MLDPLDPKTLKKAREGAGLTRAKLAELSKVDESTVFRLEMGATDPRLSATWAPIVRALQAYSTPEPEASERAA